ncbi:Hydrogenase-3 nickel incorporation protein HypA [Blastococcus sp. DSM 46786]|uniref:hydrogenase maturation nickel metallochaperone HypA/HybF n=1 Tax=Blastococcus sp. DSM 46786 TaxID=1798227 RepID=UPI0008BDF567|nr:hydrogenase maturation nickel metallochaperone HypA [Blastococcus sp. DSM 46786]SEK54745.1 Hydrogenase-3 nickel incorporation protein HypA [Blastococcus sp. DSM 46786]
MHELAISQAVVDAVRERTGDQRVRSLRLVVGRLSGVVPDALRFSFELVAEGTPLEGADLVIEEPGGRARCRSCGTEFGTEGLVVLCPCGSADVAVTAGSELLVRSVEVA